MTIGITFIGWPENWHKVIVASYMLNACFCYPQMTEKSDYLYMSSEHTEIGFGNFGDVRTTPTVTLDSNFFFSFCLFFPKTSVFWIHVAK